MGYKTEYHQGLIASSEDRCPYPVSLLGRRCAWFAGYNDARAWP